jgi:integrase/recombinase XerD
MPRKGERKAPVGAWWDAESLWGWRERHMGWLRVHNYSPATIEGRESALRRFIAWAEERGLRVPGEITKPILESYQRHLSVVPLRSGRPMTFRSQHGALQHVKGYFRWLSRQNVIPANPAAEIEMPKREMRLPLVILTADEVERVATSIDLNEPLGVRDRAIVEVLYGTAIRRMELVQLRIEDVDAERGTLAVRQGKGKRDRLVPLGERALGWVEKYRRDVRAELVAGHDDGVLFLSQRGQPLTKMWVSHRVRVIVTESGIGKRGACHVFRHTAATLMLENGADVRMVQELLGHASLEATQLYTHVSIRKLQEVHAATHPGAKLGRREKRKDEEEREGGEARVDELVAALSAEDDDEDE